MRRLPSVSPCNALPTTKHRPTAQPSVVLILIFGTLSGAGFNPVMTLSEEWRKNMPKSDVIPYIGVQLIGAYAGVAAPHLVFGDPLFFAFEHVKTGPSQSWTEFVATFGPVGVIIGRSRSDPSLTPFAVAAYITAAYWFTSSTSFANPAVTLARAASITFAGVCPVDTPGFIIAPRYGMALLLAFAFGRAVSNFDRCGNTWLVGAFPHPCTLPKGV